MPTDPPKEHHEHNPLVFPDNFLWGTATSAHQVEGNNVYSDWWEWELMNQPPEKRSGRAADQYNKFEQDFSLLKDLNQNAHRLSIEWARIESEEGKFNQAEIEHYRKVLKSLKDKNIKVMLTLWHFTIPRWLAKKGGWENSKTVDYFTRYVKEVVPLLDEFVDFWITLNEPGIYTYMGYLIGYWPPQVKNKFRGFRVEWNLAAAHKKTYKLIKSLSTKPVGVANNVQSFHSAHKHSLVEQIAVYFSDIIGNHAFYKLTKGHHDFIGVNYYFHHRINKKNGLLPGVEDVIHQAREVSDLGWEVYPEGLFDVLIDLSDHKPIYVTECGIASTNDDRRTRFLISYLNEVYRAIKAGVNVKGFFYWSFIDNFEWAEGFDPRFGLVEIDYKTQERKVRNSAFVYSEIAKYNNIPHTLLKLLGHTVRVSDVLCNQHEGGPKALCEHI
ncbi:MAG: hypothetical protein ACD_30C00041G0005 [uncultured bacterium]|uniref:Beta-glucosidase A n=3 Tax=Candidatus Daviesiibacteriota TaxID=1752718 RepID=A0A0G0HAF6_9BACT|nr:MAG: hypothetical protein ACD_30C00041G0005 [uncultured bacterium]KKQ09079.1 MAG: Beta-glucosidase A [Candidatus Daviesbacteria bacterium GW2011_GWB1_36_5]KKQ16114.1 MAG: Beta-glucosidase A [Candidatus Daviesbacteria bacterium GW2011_GWA1_36_8]OGE32160.1 MAG: hypothetical protein A3C99_02720 [Candidatus Daviesbacteria bacterium RIFCSPHIGHO2_02_FULL_37_9]OGE34591.1 MAG: hypothetical protein A3E66_04855 [Candidatus Daviesbacteria bacterium RIFCSPHIGHO2_12_FULL_37_16]